MKKKFAKQQLLDWGLPYTTGKNCDVEVISHEMVDRSRWSVIYNLIFRTNDQPQDHAWLVSYSNGATEYQDETPWEYDSEVEATLLVRKTKTVEVWEPAE